VKALEFRIHQVRMVLLREYADPSELVYIDYYRGFRCHGLPPTLLGPISPPPRDLFTPLKVLLSPLKSFHREYRIYVNPFWRPPLAQKSCQRGLQLTCLGTRLPPPGGPLLLPVSLRLFCVRMAGPSFLPCSFRGVDFTF